HLIQRIIRDGGTSEGLDLDALLSPLREAEKAIEALGGQIDVGLLVSLRDTLRRMRLFAATLCQRTGPPSLERPTRPVTRDLPGNRRWQRFRWLCRKAFPDRTVPGTLLALGEAVGKGILGLYCDGGKSEERKGLTQTDACLSGVVEAATALREE